MLRFNFATIFAIRGITNPKAYLRQAGFSYDTAESIADSSLRRMNLDVLEKICAVLNCTPHDVLEWNPDKGVSYPDVYALNTLKKEKKEFKIARLLKKLPLEKLEELEKLADGFEKK